MEILDFAAVTHRGVVKTVNEDSIAAVSPVFVVADGVSGSNRGDRASALVTQFFSELAGRSDLTADLIAGTLDRANHEILRLQREEGHDAATTACGAVGLRMGQVAYWLMFNVGDSRIYRMSGPQRQLQQVSVDHSHVQELVDAGLITARQAETHPDRNVVTRAVGASGPFEPDYWLVPMLSGDRLLLCSDGLLHEAPMSEINSILTRVEPPGEAVDRLLDLALRCGARDNVSIIVVDVHVSDGLNPQASEPR